MRPLGGLGQIEISEIHLKYPASIAAPSVQNGKSPIPPHSTNCQKNSLNTPGHGVGERQLSPFPFSLTSVFDLAKQGE